MLVYSLSKMFTDSSLRLIHDTDIKKCIVLTGSQELCPGTGCSGSKHMCCVCTKWQRDMEVKKNPGPCWIFVQT